MATVPGSAGGDSGINQQELDEFLNDLGGETYSETPIVSTQGGKNQVFLGDDGGVLVVSTSGVGRLGTVVVDGERVQATDLVLGTNARTGLGNSGDNNILGNTSNNTIQAGGGADNVNASDGNDNVNGGAGNDTLMGGSGRDTINGGVGNDDLSGGTGNDTILGGAGNDTIAGGAGSDKLTGGAGDDTFIVDAVDGGVDMVTDFKAGDRLDLSGNNIVGFDDADGDAFFLITDGDGNVAGVSVRGVSIEDLNDDDGDGVWTLG